jgi:hypothetical protein
MLGTLLIITVLGIGGPPRRPPLRYEPYRLSNAAVSVRRSGSFVARSTTGSLHRRLRPGLYELSAALDRTCQTKTVRLSRRPVHVKLYCSIK